MTNVRPITGSAVRALARPDALVIASTKPTRSITVATLDGGPAGDDPALYAVASKLVRALAAEHGGQARVMDGAVRFDLDPNMGIAPAVGEIVTGLLVVGWPTVVLFSKPCPACGGGDAVVSCTKCEGAGQVLTVPPKRSGP